MIQLRDGSLISYQQQATARYRITCMTDEQCIKVLDRSGFSAVGHELRDVLITLFNGGFIDYGLIPWPSLERIEQDIPAEQP